MLSWPALAMTQEMDGVAPSADRTLSQVSSLQGAEM